jgi:hypothetical protein
VIATVTEVSREEDINRRRLVTWTVEATDNSCLPDAPASERTDRYPVTVRYTQRVRDRVWVASCWGCRLAFKPREMVLGASRPYFRGLRWRGWGKRRSFAKGESVQIICSPSCAEGPTWFVPVRLTLYGRRHCANVDRYAYTRIKWREEGRTQKARLPCSALH